MLVQVGTKIRSAARAAASAVIRAAALSMMTSGAGAGDIERRCMAGLADTTAGYPRFAVFPFARGRLRIQIDDGDGMPGGRGGTGEAKADRGLAGAALLADE